LLRVRLCLFLIKFSTRHAQLQVNDELMAQRVEKVAQRRVEERNEKIKSARKTRFDLKLNPFFSRPIDSITKEFVRLQQEQQQQQQIQPQRVLITTPTDSLQSNNNQTSYNSNGQTATNVDIISKQITTKIVIKTKKLPDSTDDDESGTPAASVIETNQNTRSNLYQSPSPTSKRPTIKSATTRHSTTTDAVTVGAIKKLKLIFPSTFKTRYRHLFLLDKIAYIYIQLVVMLGHKTMTGGQFRSFAKYV
jgi:hypothetical protein